MARLIAIDLGSYAAKVIVYGGGTKEHELEAALSQRVPQEGTGTPPMADRLASLDLILRKHPEWREAHLTEVSWSTERSSVRRLKLPFTTAAQIAQTLPFAVEAEVPFELDDMLVAWREAGEPGDVLTLVTPEATAAELLDGLDERGLDPRRLVPDGDLLARYASYEDTVSAIIDVGHTHTVVSLGRGGKALWFRSIDVAGRTFTRAIQSALQCAWHEAEALKHAEPIGLHGDEEDSNTRPSFRDDEPTDPAFHAAMPSKAREALSGAVGLLLAEVRSTLVQAEDDLGVSVDDVVLTGGGSRLPDLRRWLAEDLGLPVRAPTFEGLPGVGPEHALAQALAADLAAPGDQGRLDLRVGELAYKGGLTAPGTLLRYGGAFLGSFLAAVLTIFVLQYRQLTAEQDMVEERLREVVMAAGTELPEDVDTTKAVTMLAEVVGQLEEESKFVGDAGGPPPMVNELFKISKAFPPHPDVKVNIDRMEVTPGAILLNGVTEGYAQVDRIADSLTNSGFYNRVEKSTGNRDNKGNLQFTVNIDRTSDDDEPEDGAGDGEDG
ncbi:MAG TPA: rod shape-determining protein [Myxococcota bacterium]|nr:rod shape-determining protein [Myxococcota bacterium]